MTSRKVDDILAERQWPRNALERLVKHETARGAWTEQLRAVLPADLAPHCRVADVQRGRMIIHVASAVWATRLRFAMPTVQPALRSLMDFAGVEEIRIRTMREADGSR